MSDSHNVGRPRERERLFGRFEILEEIGAGGFGRVLRAKDRETGTEVALKELHRFGADALLRFKKEFRLLADIQHPNLVRVGELFESEGRWGFSMELVPGADFLSWVREGEPARGFDEVRLRDGVTQLAEGLLALHGRSLLHRDVKPQNVRIRPDGRLVLLDFGLVSHLSHLSAGRQTSEAAAGTAAYMAPEQARERGVGEAADWYALGVLIYEALTGRVPFEGTAFQILHAKQEQVPAPPSAMRPGVPRDLDLLCAALLARDPNERPSGQMVLSALGRQTVSLAPAPSLSLPAGELFVGRSEERKVLQQRFEAAQHTRLSFVMVQGESGVGKSALVRQFLADLRAREPRVVILEARCHAAEQVPFKMFDGVVDELSRHLRELPKEAVEALLPADAGLLPILFPVLERVEAIAQLHRRHTRDRANIDRFVLFAAFTQLLVRLSQTRPLVISVDDLQWGDVESVQLLRVLLDSASRLHALTVGTVRRLDALEGALGEELRALAEHQDVSVLLVAQLPQADACALSAFWLGTDAGDPRALSIATEASGHPLFIAELAGTVGDDERGLGLDAALRRRVSRLGLVPRSVLELLAVASAPTRLRTLASALGTQGDELASAAVELRNARLVRNVRRAELSCYHDRVREALLAGLEPGTLALLHSKLAQALASDEQSDPAQIARHYLGAGADELAFPWLETAAEMAVRKAAFERAVEHYRKLVTLSQKQSPQTHTHRLLLALAEALASAGRCAESARVLSSALKGASPEQRRALQVRAAQQLLQGAEISDGLSASRLALKESGLAWPSGTTGTLTRLLWQRLQLGARGLRAELRTDAQLDPQVEAQLDTMWRLWQPLIWADMLRSAELSARHLRLALRRGSARHVGLALCGEAILVSVRGGCPEKLEQLFAQATAFVAQSAAPELAAYRTFARGYVAFLGWDLRAATTHLTEAERLYREECPGEAWLLANTRGALLQAWYNAGEHARMQQAATVWMQEAEARGDQFAQASISVLGMGCIRHLMADQPELALSEVRRLMAPWTIGAFGGQHLGEVATTSSIHMYQGGTAPYHYWQQTWPRMSSSFLVRMRFVRELLAWCRGDAALRAAVAEEGSVRAQRLSEARALLRPLQTSQSGVGRAIAPLAMAQIALLQGDRDEALVLAQRAKAALVTMGHFAEHQAELLLAFLNRDTTRFEALRSRLRDIYAQAGWLRPEPALEMTLPLYPWLLAQQG